MQKLLSVTGESENSKKKCVSILQKSLSERFLSLRPNIHTEKMLGAAQDMRARHSALFYFTYHIHPLYPGFSCGFPTHAVAQRWTRDI